MRLVHIPLYLFISRAIERASLLRNGIDTHHESRRASDASRSAAAIFRIKKTFGSQRNQFKNVLPGEKDTFLLCAMAAVYR